MHASSQDTKQAEQKNPKKSNRKRGVRHLQIKNMPRCRLHSRCSVAPSADSALTSGVSLLRSTSSVSVRTVYEPVSAMLSIFSAQWLQPCSLNARPPCCHLELVQRQQLPPPAEEPHQQQVTTNYTLTLTDRNMQFKPVTTLMQL